jgi:hypothetical protein
MIKELLEYLSILFLQHYGMISESFKHVERMREELERYGSTQFWR